MWQRLVGEFLSLLWSECVAEPGGCVFVFITECVCGRNWRMSFFSLLGSVCVWQKLEDEFLSLLWSVCV